MAAVSNTAASDMAAVSNTAASGDMAISDDEHSSSAVSSATAAASAPIASPDKNTLSNAAAKTTLMDRVQALPPELFNDILEYVLVMSAKHRPYVHKHYKPPLHLHLTHDLRRKYAEDHYRTITFALQSMSERVLWLKSLPLEHLTHIKSIRLERDAADKFVAEHQDDLTAEATRRIEDFQTAWMVAGLQLTNLKGMSAKVVIEDMEGREKECWVAFVD